MQSVSFELYITFCREILWGYPGIERFSFLYRQLSMCLFFFVFCFCFFALIRSVMSVEISRYNLNR